MLCEHTFGSGVPLFVCIFVVVTGVVNICFCLFIKVSVCVLVGFVVFLSLI